MGDAYGDKVLNRYMGFGAGIECFAPTGYKPAKPIVELIDEVAKVKDLLGLEFHYPTEVDESDVKDVLSRYNIKTVAIAPVLSQEAQWSRGALSALNEDTRKRAIVRCRKAIDITRELDSEILII